MGFQFLPCAALFYHVEFKPNQVSVVFSQADVVFLEYAVHKCGENSALKTKCFLSFLCFEINMFSP